jgi:exodeoxyribonuclease V beta subunit
MNETVASVENFDLHRHAVVEASAGTGKTYTIEQLVLRLLTEEAVPLEQILIVTFTEKATGELKVRLRGMLERAIQKDDDFVSLLKPALDQFDQAPIFTIHGFCQRLLQEYALEQGQDFRAELVNDVDLLKTSLKEIQRKQWRTYFGDRLKTVLEKAFYNRETADVWDRKVLDIASKYKPRCENQLRPAFVPDWWQRLDEADANWAGQLEIHTINLLHEHLREFKRQRGLQSFDDMIASVEESLDVTKNPDAENFLQRLRQRYRYGIVDEFQDTDPLQWRIFRRIFLEVGESKLFIVGDPKQAIFGFRGADLPTYLRAADEMKAHFDASAYPLDVNWRSDQNLLDALNCVFGNGEWFPKSAGISYLDVHAPDDDARQTRVDQDRTNRPALTLVDTAQWDNAKVAQKHYARFVVSEIQRLLAEDRNGPSFSFIEKGRPSRPLNAGDICILVMKRTDADPITPLLDAAGIPYSFYKQTGLWQSDEAVHLEVLLQTLAQPEDRASFRKALLTCFFRVKPEELVRAPDVPMTHPARQLYQTWLGYAENRQWSALCRSLLEDTGLLFSPLPIHNDSPLTPGPSPGGRGELATLRHLLTTLEQIGHGFNLDLLGMLEWIDNRRQQRDVGDADVQPVEMGIAKVKIMTIHASKGLEFPIVFLAGGFTQALVGGSYNVYRDEQQRVVFDLGVDADAKERVKAERLSEQRRLLYVAMTRPIFKLYIPKMKRPSRASGFLGPLGTILMPALEQACPDKLGPMIAEIVTPTLSDSLLKPSEEPAPDAPCPATETFHIDGPLFPAIDPNLGKRRIVTRSFSSMTKHHLSHVGEGSSFGEQVPLAEDEAATPHDREDPLRGPVFGDMVHNVLEQIGFAEVGRAAAPDDLFNAGTHARKLIDQEIKLSIALLRTRTPIDQLEQVCRQQIANLVWHALRTPLAEIGVPLCAIPKVDRLPEIEFLYPEHNDSRLEERFITGFMDLLFRKDEKYYLVDWKTNLLPGYSREQIERSMNESDYHRQYRLYLQAIARWLRRARQSPPSPLRERGAGGEGEAFLNQFGGVYYLYLRGLNGRDETTGVYFHRPTQQELDLDFVLKHG